MVINTRLRGKPGRGRNSVKKSKNMLIPFMPKKPEVSTGIWTTLSRNFAHKNLAHCKLFTQELCPVQTLLTGTLPIRNFPTTIFTR